MRSADACGEMKETARRSEEMKEDIDGGLMVAVMSALRRE